MNAEACDKGCGRAMFALFLAILIFSPLALGGTGPWEFLVIQMLTAGVLGVWGVRLWVAPKPRFLWPPMTWCVLAFAVYGIGRYWTCDLEYAGRHEFLEVLVYTFLFLAVVNNLFQQEMTQAISVTLIIMATAISSYAIFQFLTHANKVWWLAAEDLGRASGTFMSADHFCGYLEMIVPLVLSLLLAGRIKPLTRVLLGYCLLVILFSVAVTYSRAGWLSTIAGMFFVLVVLLGHRNHRKAAGSVLALLLAGGVVFVTCFLSKTALFLERVTDAQGKVNLDASMRKRIWSDARRMWLDHFWWGVGPGHFDWRYNEYRSQAVQLRAGWPHCDYLNVLTDWGMVGGLMVAAGIVVALIGVARTWPRVRRAEKDFGSGMSNRFAVFLGAVGGLAAMAIHSLVDFNLHVPADALVAATLLALLSSNLRFATERYWHKVTVPAKVGATVLFAAGMVYFGWETFRLGHEAVWLARAASLPPNTPAQAKILEMAFHYEPMNFTNAYSIGEGYRNGGLSDPIDNPDMLPTAMAWYQKSQKLNPYYSLNYLREGQYLDLLGQHEEAWKCFDHADRLDPNGYFTAANVGLHFLQTGELVAARPWLYRSLDLKPKENPIASEATARMEQGLAELAGDIP